MADSALQLPDPKLKLGIENVPVQGGNGHRLTRDGMTMGRVGIMQDYVSGDKRQRKADTLRAEAEKPRPAARRSARACSSRRHRPGWSWRSAGKPCMTPERWSRRASARLPHSAPA